MLSGDNRLDLFRAIIKDGTFWGNGHSITKLEFLSRIWDLRRMSSSDTRFSDAYEDANKHLMNNDDWNDEYTFIDRFKLLQCNEDEFIKFLNTVLSPDVRNSSDDIEKFVTIIEDELPEGYTVRESGQKNGLPIMIVRASNIKDVEDYPVGIEKKQDPILR